MSEIDIILLDNLNKIKEEINMIKPASYQELIALIKQNFKNMPKNYEIFILDKDNKEIKINDDENYKLIKDHLFIGELDKKKSKLSMFGKIYVNLTESGQDKLDQLYMCIFCSNIIKNEKPYLCYKCQKIYHEKCLKDWEQKCMFENKDFHCPHCRNILALNNWHKKLDYEETRKAHAILINQITEYKKNINMNKNINKIKDKKINELIKNYENYVEKTNKIFKNILNQIYSINSLLEVKDNYKLNDLINIYSSNLNNLNLDNISNIINKEMDQIQNYILNNNNIKKNNIINNNNKNQINEGNPKIFLENKINLIYFTTYKGIFNIFGKKFVQNNKEKIELIINDKENPLVDKYELKDGKNIITMIIKNHLTNLSSMFYGCKCLNDISELKNLNVKYINDFSCIFFDCPSLSNIKALENWDVSNGINFEYMFWGCKSLYNIEPLQNWNVSNGINFRNIFNACLSLKDIKPLQYWNVSNGKNFSYMFNTCSSLSDIKPLQNWNVSNCTDFSFMFWGCSSLSNIEPLQKWNVQNCNNFSFMFCGCSSLFDITPLQNWNVSNGNNFSFMFSKCLNLSNIKPLENWNVSNGINFQNMFGKCPLIKDFTPLKKWNTSNRSYFQYMLNSGFN